MFGTTETDRILTYRTICNSYSQEEQMFKLIGSDMYKQVFSAPYRKDKNPSCSIYENTSGLLLLRDRGRDVSVSPPVLYALNNNKVIADRSEIHNFIHSGEYHDSLPAYLDFLNNSKRIIPDFLKGRVFSKEIPKIDVKIAKHQYQKDDFSKLEKKLLWYDIFLLERVFLNKKHIPALNNSFGYLYRLNGEIRWKIYNPKSHIKWLSNIPIDTIDISRDTKDEDVKIICTSKKDRLFFEEIFNIKTYCYQSENYLPEKLLPNTIAYVPDLDNEGMKYGKRYEEKFGLPLLLPNINNKQITEFKRVNIKDVADIVTYYNIEKLIQLYFNNLLNLKRNANC